MGIKGLLKQINSIETDKSIAEYEGMTLAVDGYSWLHKGVYNCGYQIVIENDYTTFLKSFMARVEVLNSLGIKIVVVFDGDKLPSKDNTELKREEKRARCIETARAELKRGNYKEANKKFAEGLDITPTLAYHTIEYVKTKYQIDCKF